MVEVGVYRGNFASQILRRCEAIEKYYMLDPWRHLDNWNKPANTEDDVFEQILAEARSRTDFAAEKRVILRGKTTEAVDEIPDGELDFAYIDGDHTLRGVTIDLIRLFPKVRPGGWIGGDDFCSTIWQRSTEYEPTLVFPFAVYFAEAVDARLYALPYSQFLLEKDETQPFDFVDLTGEYGDVFLRDQLDPDRLLKVKLLETFPFVKRAGRRIKRLVPR
ncbi:MAG: class I SAM-dependent methyltransferase [Bacillota bacterium]|nr:class I SAM-dependent methyltransferase [Bacillota bacterium]